MTARKLLALPLLALAGFALMWAFLTFRYAHAEDAGVDPVVAADHAPAAVPAVPSGPCIDADGPGPAPCVSSPLKQPGASLDTAAAAKRVGWPLLVFVVLFFLAVMAGEVVPALKKGRVALFMAGGTTALAAACNAGFDGGSWYAMAAAAGAVLLTMVQGNRTVAEMLKAMQPKAVG